MFGTLQPQPQEPWRLQLDRFVTVHEREVAALAWGLVQEQSDHGDRDILGIDLKPTPHFVYCSQTALENLNKSVANHLQEILGLVAGYKPDQEVLILAIGPGQVKLINFQPDPLPPQCFEQVGKDTATLLEELEQRLHDYLGSTY